MSGLDRQQYSRLFKLLDRFARQEHGWFVAELFVPAGETGYTICFRPQAMAEEDRYSCVYWELELNDAKEIIRNKVIPAALHENIGAALRTVKR